MSTADLSERPGALGTVFTAYRIDLVATGPMAVGGSASLEAVDSPIARTPSGEPWVPASSVAGALREHIRREGLDPVDWMGGPSSVDGVLEPSPIRVVHTEVSSDARVDVRSQTAIDRRTGAAAQGTLRNVEHLEPGTSLRIDLLVDGRHDRDGELSSVLGSFAPLLGARRTSGEGGTELRSLRWGMIDLASAEGLAQWLSAGGPSLIDLVATEPLDVRNSTERAAIVVRCTIVDPLLIEPGRDRSDAEKKNRVTSRSTLHGSSLKGVVRSRAEFILRSLAAAADVDEVAAMLLTEQLFGSSDRRGRLRFTNSAVSDEVREVRPHVAIDRFTGGASAGRLFEEEVLVAGSFDLEIELLDEIEPWERCLIEAVLTDIHDGYVGFGARTARGYGTVRLSPVPQMPDLGPVMEALTDVG